jgi:hypothetical protein
MTTVQKLPMQQTEATEFERPNSLRQPHRTELRDASGAS